MTAEPTAARSAPEPPEPPRVELRPRPQVRRIGRAGVLLAMIAGLIVLTVLTFRYSREGLGDSVAASRPRSLSKPLDPEQIERLKPPEPPPLPPELATGGPPAPRGRRLDLPRPASPYPSAQANALREAMAAPLQVRRPDPRVGRRTQALDLSQLESSIAPRIGLRSDRSAGAGPGGVGGAAAPQLPDPRVLASPGPRTLQAALESPPTQPILQQGTYIPAILAQRLTSDLAGPVRAVIARDVLDSLTHSQVLLPRGSVALGRQVRQPLFGEDRLLLVWDRLLLPDGSSLELSEVPAAGGDGSVGVPGKTRRHWARRLGGTALLSLLGAGVQLSQPQRSAVGLLAPDAGQIAAGELGLELGRLSQQILRHLVDLPPTISLEPGARLHLLLTQDLAFGEPDPSQPLR